MIEIRPTGCSSDTADLPSIGPAGKHSRAHSYILLLLAVSIVFLWFSLTGDVGLDLMDEGYLWYDTHQTLHGGVPIRDFRSYDPGRYYWGAFWTSLMGEGIRSLRISGAIMQAIGLFLGLLVARRVIWSNWAIALFGILLVVWMYPRHKLFEHTLEISALYFAVLLIEKPCLRRYFQAGALVGLAAFFGKNLGVYFLTGFSFLILFLEFGAGVRQIFSRYAMWLTGVAAGYLPMIFMLLFVPDFAARFADSVARLMGPHAPVKVLPIPFPWTVSLSEMVSWEDVQRFVLGCLFLLVLAVYAIGLLRAVSLRKHAARSASVLTASVFLGIPLLSHFLSRADLDHFFESTTPLLFCLIGFRGASEWNESTRFRTWGIPILAALAMFAVVNSPQILFAAQKISHQVLGKGNLEPYGVLGDTVWIPDKQIRYLEAVQHFVTARVGPKQMMLIAPYEPGLYRILQIDSPIWDPFPIHNATGEEEDQAIAELRSKDVRWALIRNAFLDGKPERSFSRTHHKIWEYLNRNSEQVRFPWLLEDQLLLHRKATSATPGSPHQTDDRSLFDKLANLASRRGRLDETAWTELRSIYEDPEKMSWILNKAQNGNAVVQFHLGFAHQKGAGAATNYDEAAKWYRKAADQGLAVAQTSLGFMYVNGWGVPKDYGEAVKWYLKAADQDDAVAQTLLGFMYEKGGGVPTNHEEAAKWYRKAAEQGYAAAQTSLAFMLMNGWGVPRDYQQAMKWYRMAADQNDALAQMSLGLMHEKGWGVPRNVEEAAEWYKKASVQGHYPAKQALERLLENQK